TSRLFFLSKLIGFLSFFLSIFLSFFLSFLVSSSRCSTLISFLHQCSGSRLQPFVFVNNAHRHLRCLTFLLSYAHTHTHTHTLSLSLTHTHTHTLSLSLTHT